MSVTGTLAYLRTGIVNVYFIGAPGAGDRRWLLVDAGIPGFAGRIRAAAAERFGRGARPRAIVLTHGHFDHVGSLKQLADEWDCLVYAHPLELPYLTGQSSYPPPDPTVGGGAMAALSWMFPRGPIDLRSRVRALPADGRVPGADGWRWIHTPGHAPGHVSLFRDDDRTLVAGDAFVTVRQESLLSALSQAPIMHGPPAYFTPDWVSAQRSVELLSELEPEVAATGHGMPLRGAPMREALHRLVRDFERVAIPDEGRYVGDSATAGDRGVTYVPPLDARGARSLQLAVGGAAVAGALIALSLIERSLIGRRTASR